VLEADQDLPAAEPFTVERVASGVQLVRSPDKLFAELERREVVPVRVKHGDQAFAPLPKSASTRFPKGTAAREAPREPKPSVTLTRITRVLDRQSRGHILTGTQDSVLATAARLGPVRITELAEVEGINPTMMSRIVGKLEDAGLLHRRPDPDDRRAALVEPTAAGRELQRHVREVDLERLTARVRTVAPYEKPLDPSDLDC